MGMDEDVCDEGELSRVVGRDCGKVMESVDDDEECEGMVIREGEEVEEGE